MKSRVSTRIKWLGVRPWWAIQSAIARGIPVKPIATVRKAAPVSMKAIMQEVFIAPMTLAWNAFRSSDPVASERISEPSTPSTAASVGVAMPA